MSVLLVIFTRLTGLNYTAEISGHLNMVREPCSSYFLTLEIRDLFANCEARIEMYWSPRHFFPFNGRKKGTI